MITSDGYILTKEEWNAYHDFKPSWLQKFVYFFFPTRKSIKLKLYKAVKRDWCI